MVSTWSCGKKCATTAAPAAASIKATSGAGTRLVSRGMPTSIASVATPTPSSASEAMPRRHARGNRQRHRQRQRDDTDDETGGDIGAQIGAAITFLQLLFQAEAERRGDVPQDVEVARHGRKHSTARRRRHINTSTY